MITASVKNQQLNHRRVTCDTTAAHLLVILVDVAVSELFPAQFTLVRFVLAVNDLMSRHLVQTLERAVADLAGVRSLL